MAPVLGLRLWHILMNIKFLFTAWVSRGILPQSLYQLSGFVNWLKLSNVRIIHNIFSLCSQVRWHNLNFNHIGKTIETLLIEHFHGPEANKSFIHKNVNIVTYDCSKWHFLITVSFYQVIKRYDKFWNGLESLYLSIDVLVLILTLLLMFYDALYKCHVFFPGP